VLSLSTGHGCEGEEGKDAAAFPHSKRRHKCVPKRCYGAASSSSTLLLMRCFPREAHHRETFAGVTALPLLHMADWRPISWRSDFPRTKQSKGKSYHFRHEAGLSGSSPVQVFVLRNSTATSFCGGERQGPDCVFQSCCEVFSIIVRFLSRNPLICRGFSAFCTHRLLILAASRVFGPYPCSKKTKHVEQRAMAMAMSVDGLGHLLTARCILDV
jgi:hypothetical protein